MVTRDDAVLRAAADLAAARPVVVLDSTGPSADGELVLAGEHATTELIAFAVRHTAGFLTVPMVESIADRLDLPPMRPTADAGRPGGQQAVAVDARHGITTGISAADRARTIRLLAAPDSAPEQFCRPGHVVPVRVSDGGVLARAGRSEAVIDLLRVAGLAPVAAVGQVVSPSRPSELAHGDELRAFAAEHGLAVVSVDEIVGFRRRTGRLVRRMGSAQMPFGGGVFTAVAYRTSYDEREHLAFVFGDLGAGNDVLVRVHRECLPGNIFGSLGCDCRAHFDAALAAIQREGRGVMIYVRGGEGRATEHLAEGAAVGPTTAASGGCTTGAQILDDLHVRSVRLLSAEPLAADRLRDAGIEVLARVDLTAA